LVEISAFFRASPGGMTTNVDECEPAPERAAHAPVLPARGKIPYGPAIKDTIS